MSAAPLRRPLDHLLVDAAQARTNRTRGPGTKVVKVILVYADGGRELIEVTPELAAAARRSREEADALAEADRVSLTRPERTCLEALSEATEPLTGDEVADRAGYGRGAGVYRSLASLVKKRCVAKKGGYVITSLGRAAVGLAAEARPARS